jgi:hypothetical protein
MHAIVPPELAWLARGLLFALVVGLGAALVVGLMLLARPATLFAVNARLSRWIDTDERLRKLETPLMWERVFYRHHRILGSILTAGAAFVLLSWMFRYDRSSLMRMLGPQWSASHLDWIVAAAEWLVVALHALILLVGVVVFVRPSLLKNIERTANQWHDIPRSRSLDVHLVRLDTGFELYPRLSGLILVLAATWCLVVLAPAIS